MRKPIPLLTLVAMTFALFLPCAPAQAQATRTWISGVGDDVNPCSRTAPCKTFAGAISKTAAGGEIDCLDPGGFGGVTITKSITFDCSGTFGSILVNGTPGITINSDSAATVRIRGLSINGAGNTLGTIGIRAIGANTSATVVIIENVAIDGFSGRGVSDERTGGGKLFIINSTIRDNGGAAVGVSGSSAVFVSIDRVRALNSLFGIAIGTAAKAQINQSTLAGNTNGGLETEGTSQVNVDSTSVSGNGIGFQVVAGTVRVSNSDVAFNTTGVNGTITSFLNNRFTANGAGGTISQIGSTSNPSGQQ
jgi:hypothetical protein